MARPRPAAEEEFLNRLRPGDYVEVEYIGDSVAHERLLLWPLSEGLWMVRSPDSDEWAERLDGRDPTSGPKVCRARRPPGRHRDRLPLYRFREKLEERALRSAMLRGLRQATEEGSGQELEEVRTVRNSEGTLVSVEDFFRASRSPLLGALRSGSRRSGGSAEAAAAEGDDWRRFAAADGAAGRTWLLRAPAGGYEIGDVVEPVVGKDWVIGRDRVLVRLEGEWTLAEAVAASEAPGAAARIRRDRRGGGVLIEEPVAEVDVEGTSPLSGERALGLGGGSPARKSAKAVSDEVDDARTLWVDWDTHGDRFKAWKVVVQESFSEDLGEGRFDGAATALHMCRAMERQGGDPRGWLERWMRDKHVEPSDRVAHELRALVEALYLGGCVDQLNMGSLCSVEVLCRRVAVIVEAYTVPGKPSWDHARYYSGVAAAEEVIAPGLRSYVHKRAKEDFEMGNARLRGMPRTAASSADAGGSGGGAAGSGGAGGEEEGARGRGAGRGRGKGGQRTPPPAAA